MKHEKINNEGAAYFVFTMQSAAGMEELHNNFAHKHHQIEVNLGLSLTIAWSGETVNVPVRPYEKNNIGFICDPRGLKVPQADLIATNSLGMFKPEPRRLKNKNNLETRKIEFQHALKKYTTDLTRHHYDNNGALVETPGGSIVSWAHNILDKFYKHRNNAQSRKDYFNVRNLRSMKLNEGIGFKRENVAGYQPIAAPMIYKKASNREVKQLLTFLEKHENYNQLFLYDDDADRNILRSISRAEAMIMLQTMSNSSSNDEVAAEFTRMFIQASPYTRDFFELDAFEEEEIERSKQPYVHSRIILDNQKPEASSGHFGFMDTVLNQLDPTEHPIVFSLLIGVAGALGAAAIALPLLPIGLAIAAILLGAIVTSLGSLLINCEFYAADNFAASPNLA